MWGDPSMGVMSLSHLCAGLGVGPVLSGAPAKKGAEGTQREISNVTLRLGSSCFCIV